jgi:hypothetical protein
VRSPIDLDCGIAKVDGADADLVGFVCGDKEERGQNVTKIAGDIKCREDVSRCLGPSEVLCVGSNFPCV